MNRIRSHPHVQLMWTPPSLPGREGLLRAVKGFQWWSRPVKCSQWQSRAVKDCLEMSRAVKGSQGLSRAFKGGEQGLSRVINSRDFKGCLEQSIYEMQALVRGSYRGWPIIKSTPKLVWFRLLFGSHCWVFSCYELYKSWHSANLGYWHFGGVWKEGTIVP